MKIRLIFLSLLFVFFSANSAEKEFTPNNTIILWDLHGVILEKDLDKMAQVFWNFPKWELFSIVPLLFSTTFLELTYKRFFDASSSEEFIRYARKHDYPYFEELIVGFINSQKPIDGTIKIIEKLHQLGYTQQIGSNIGKTSFKALINPDRHPEFENIFSYFDLKHSYVVTIQPNGNVIKKPNPDYFIDYLHKNNIDLSKTNVIFIDDLLENVKSADKVGLIGIHFINATLLQIKLESIKVLPSV